jgi:signal transduction histidine kinase
MARRHHRRPMTAPARPATPPEQVDFLGLRAYLRMNLVAAMVAVAVLVAIRVFMVASDLLVVVCLLVVALCYALWRLDRRLSDRRVIHTIALLAALNWSAALAAVFIVPFALIIVGLVVLTPAMLALPHLDRARLEPLFGATLVTAAVVAAAARLQPGSGLEQLVPAWLVTGLVVLFVTLISGLIMFAAWRSHAGISARASAIRESRERLVAAGERERREIERELRDGAERRLGSAVAWIERTRRLVTDAPGEATGSIDDLIEELAQVGAELRTLAHGIYPAILADRGLDAAVRHAARGAGMPVAVQAHDLGRYPPEVELAVYRCCVDAIREPPDPTGDGLTVRLRGRPDGGLVFEIAGGGPSAPAGAARPITPADRIGPVGGHVLVRHGPGPRVHGEIDPITPTRPGTRGPASRAAAAIWRTVAGAWSGLASEAPAEVSLSGLLVLRGFVTVAGAFVVTTCLVVRNPWLGLVLAVSAATVLALTWSIRLARRRRLLPGVLVADAMCSVSVVLATALVPVTLYYHPILSVIPSLLAIPLLSRPQFLGVVVANLVVTVVLTLVGRLSPGVGIQQRFPAPLLDLDIVLSVPICTALVLSLAWRAHVSLSERATALQWSRERLIAAGDRERRRIERDLHDGAQQSLAACAVRLRVVQRLLPVRPGQAAAMLGELADELRQAVRELGELAHGLYPAALIEHGLEEALRRVARRSPLATSVAVHNVPRPRPEVALGVYFCCLEGLQNAVKHAGENATVSMRLVGGPDGELTFDVSDTGVGCDPALLGRGHGLSNIEDRVGALGGSFTVHAEPGAGVRIRGRIGP